MKAFFLFVLLSILNVFNSGIPKTAVAIQPFKGFDKNLVDTLSKTVRQIYGFNVVVLPEKELPKNAFTSVKTPRYRADSLLVFLRKNKPALANYIIGITNKDISTTKYDVNGNIKKPETTYADWGVFGLGYCPGPSCMVSTFRLRNATKDIVILRFKKVCIHELGHNLGLPHCTTPHCVMSDANESIKTVDNDGLELCPKCKSKIKTGT